MRERDPRRPGRSVIILKLELFIFFLERADFQEFSEEQAAGRGPNLGRSGIILKLELFIFFLEQADFQEFSEGQAAGRGPNLRGKSSAGGLQACRGTGCKESSQRSRRQISGPILREKEVSERTVTGLRVYEWC
ncbi:hypothetical protein NDU88_001870 [Pleurodeles waltl]|uniref:Uncharacterized protein n=1 Tax=Pleurodeles waltl TaxID=8319 RepID=A0AAV7T1J2_PLEWA|nr:hypothetical protein NDU88_001870 [Pleurodeles waltl]